MRILHTSDWHLGQEFFNRDRTEEYQYFFAQLREIVRREQPDAMVVSGDVYHTAVPSTQVQRMYTDSMLSIHEACPQMAIIVTAGNHDSASKIEIDCNLWSHFQVHVIGALRRNEQREIDLDAHIIALPGKGWVVAVPYVYKQNLPPAEEGEERYAAFFRSLLMRVKERNVEGLPVVLSAHLTACCREERCDVAGHAFATDEELGGLQFVDLAPLLGACDYVALGHIHHQQGVPSGSLAMRYSGSPMAVSFDEGYRHYVSLVELRHGEEPEVKPMEITPLRPLLTIPQVPVPYFEALQALRAFPDDSPAYVRLWVTSATGLPVDCNEQALKATEGKQCRFCLFKLKDERPAAQQRALMDITPDELHDKEPADVAFRYLASQNVEIAGVREMINTLKQEIEAEEAL